MHNFPKRSGKFAATAALLSSIILAAGCGGGSAQKDTAESRTDGSSRKTVLCSRAAGTIQVDGALDEWSAVEALRLDDPSDVSDPNGVKIFTRWDDNYLYVAYEVSDRFLVGYQNERDHKALYKDDMIEVLIDPRRDATDKWLEDDIVYHINILGQVKDDRGTPEGKSDAGWQSEALFAVKYDGTLNDSSDTDRGFDVELAVPWSEIGLEPRPGTSLGINFAAGDAEGPDEHLWDWCGAHPFRQPSVYGVMTLE